MSKTRLLFSRVRIIAIILACILALAGCNENNGTNPGGNEEPEEPTNQPIVTNCTVETFTILTGTKHETEVYKYVSDVEGPKIAIVGGIHGDEVAGWRTAVDFIELGKTYFRGEVLLIPKASIIACDETVRYPGSKNNGMFGGIKYSDLNRSFGSASGTNETEKISNAIIEVIKEFGAEHAIDLHESLDSRHNDPKRLGDLLIYGNSNSALFSYDCTDIYNETIKYFYEFDFNADANAPEGTFNGYFGEVLPNGIVITIETSRKLQTSRRIEQQHGMLKIILEQIWEKY